MSYKDVMWGIPWAIMQRILIDAPGYKSKKVDEKGELANGQLMTKDNAQDLIAMMNGAIMG